MKIKDFNHYIKLTKKYGKDIFYIQGGGGNTSVKFENKLYIKSSGTKFREAGNDKISVLDQASGSQLYEPDFSNLKPSMEFGLHLEIKSQYIFHLHCLRSVILSVVGKGNELVDEIRKFNIDCKILDYHTPGNDLAYAVRNLNLSLRKGIIILQNHGIIVFSDKLKEIEIMIALLEKAANKILFNLNYEYDSKILVKKPTQNNSHSVFRLPKDINVSELENYKNYLFMPDQIIFLSGKINWTPINYQKDLNKLEDEKAYFTDKGNLILTSQNTSLYEMVWALLFIIRGLMRMNVKKKYHLLSPKESLKLLKMPEEKHRKLIESEPDKQNLK